MPNWSLMVDTECVVSLERARDPARCMCVPNHLKMRVQRPPKKTFIHCSPRQMPKQGVLWASTQRNSCNSRESLATSMVPHFSTYSGRWLIRMDISTAREQDRVRMQQ